jgi:GNAT superfamily N-acetyltransferase
MIMSDPLNSVIKPVFCTAGVRIRRLDQHFLGTVAVLERAAFGDQARDASDLAALHDRGWLQAMALSADDPTSLLGYINYGLGDSKRVWIERLVVDPCRRRQGFGRALVMEALKFAIEVDAFEVTARVPEDALPAQMLFRKCRFLGESRGSDIQFVRKLFQFPGSR